MVELLDVGKIANTHGIKGEVKVIPLTDDPSRYDDLKWVYIERGGSLQKYTISGVKYFKGMVILKFKDINDMATAEQYKGLYLKIDRKNAVKLPPDTFFVCDLVGSMVYDESDKTLGELIDVLKTGSNDNYLVRDENGREILVPALKSVVKEISIENKRVVVRLPEGLIDDEV